MGTIGLFVDGMGCRRVREVTRRLRDVSGVQTVAVDTARSVAPPGAMAADDILEAFASLTYRPRLLT